MVTSEVDAWDELIYLSHCQKIAYHWHYYVKNDSKIVILVKKVHPKESKKSCCPITHFVFEDSLHFSMEFYILVVFPYLLVISPIGGLDLAELVAAKKPKSGQNILH